MKCSIQTIIVGSFLCFLMIFLENDAIPFARPRRIETLPGRDIETKTEKKETEQTKQEQEKQPQTPLQTPQKTTPTTTKKAEEVDPGLERVKDAIEQVKRNPTDENVKQFENTYREEWKKFKTANTITAESPAYYLKNAGTKLLSAESKPKLKEFVNAESLYNKIKSLIAGLQDPATIEEMVIVHERYDMLLDNYRDDIKKIIANSAESLTEATIIDALKTQKGKDFDETLLSLRRALDNESVKKLQEKAGYKTYDYASQFNALRRPVGKPTINKRLLDLQYLSQALPELYPSGNENIQYINDNRSVLTKEELKAVKDYLEIMLLKIKTAQLSPSLREPSEKIIEKTLQNVKSLYEQLSTATSVKKEKKPTELTFEEPEKSTTSPEEITMEEKDILEKFEKDLKPYLEELRNVKKFMKELKEETSDSFVIFNMLESKQQEYQIHPSTELKKTIDDLKQLLKINQDHDIIRNQTFIK